MTSFRIEPVTPTVGAEISDIDLAGPLDEKVFAELMEVWHRHHVLFFRDQDMDPASLQRLGKRLGPLHVHPQGDVEGYEGILAIHTDRNSTTYSGSKWHADVTCDREPPTASVLYLATVPDTGGDTLFVNVHAAYDALSAPMKRFLEGLTAVHAGADRYGRYFGTRPEETRDGAFPEAVHPVIAVNPATGRKMIYVNEIFTEKIVELEETESRLVLEFLWSHIAQPRFQCRFRWKADSVAMWDNHATQHLAIWDYWPQARSGYRVTVKGPPPPPV